MTAFATQSNIPMTGAGLLGRSTASVGKSSRVTIGTGLTLSAGVLSNSLDLSGYLPLSGGTLTGPITGTGGLIEQRNGLTAQCFDLFETYTSGTNNGKLRFKATSGGHQIGSARASSGSNRSLILGHFDGSDAFTAAITINTFGQCTFANDVSFGAGVQLSWSTRGMIRVIASDQFRFTDFGVARGFVISSATDGTLTLLDKAGTAAGNLVCGTITASGAITPATLTDAAAPSGSIYYSSTQSKLVYKNSGGTVNVLY